MSGLKIPAIRMPTLEEHQATSAKWWERGGTTFYDQWPAELRALSAPTKMVPVSPELAREMPKWFWDDLVKGIAAPESVIDLARRLDDVMGWHEHFIKLNSRSPKDAVFPGLPITCSGRQAVVWLNGSMRCTDDFLEFGYLPPERGCFILCREPRGFWEQTEIRAFIKDRRLIASSVYHYNDDKVLEAWVNSNELPDYARKVETYLRDKVIPSCHIETFVADVAVSRFSRDDEPELIEINPYGMSDPCLFGSYEAVEAWPGGLKTKPSEPIT